MKKALIWILSIIIILVIAIIGLYYISFRPKIETTPVNGTVKVNTFEIAKKFIPSDIHLDRQGIDATSNINLTQDELTNLAAYAVSKSSDITKYVTGLKVITADNNNLIVYITGQLSNISSQARVDFNIKSENGCAVLKYEGGKIGFLPIPESLIFNNLQSNDYIQVNKQDGTITINPKNIKGLNITHLSSDNSGLNLQLNGKVNFL